MFSSNKDLENKKVKIRFEEDIEPQEVFLDSLARKKEEEMGLSERKLEVPLSRQIIKGFYIFFLLMIFIFFLKTFQLQIIEGETFSSLANDNKTRIIQIPTERGVIYDRFSNILVKNLPSFDLVCDKRDLPQDKEERLQVLKEISEIIKKDFSQLEREIAESEFNQVLFLENIPHDVLILLETKITKLSGCKIEENTVRDYISASTFSHLIGYMGKINSEELKILPGYSITDYIGKTGIEKSYETFLRGNPGKIQIEKDTLGKIKSEEQTLEPQPGKSLVLHLDSNLQKKIEQELQTAIQRVGAKRGAAVAIDPNTGGVLALVSLPSFDNNLFSQGISQADLQEILEDPSEPLFNRAISGEYPTGSTIKPFIASAALQENIIEPEKAIYTEGKIEVPHEYNSEIIYTFLDWKNHGLVDMRKGIAVSSNVYFYTLGGGYKDFQGLGANRIKKYLSFFGWGKKTGIDLPQEKEGFLPDPAWKEESLKENWYIGNTYHLSIGQGYLRVTPLQVATAFSVIANGGKLFTPKIVQKIIDTSTPNTNLPSSDGTRQANSAQVLKEIKPEIIRENFIDPENIQVVREGMREAVTYGSSVILNSLPVKVAAKTGTAETGKEGYFHNWVTVFAPYDEPQIVLTIVVENVREAQVAALPVARQVLGWYFSQ